MNLKNNNGTEQLLLVVMFDGNMTPVRDQSGQRFYQFIAQEPSDGLVNPHQHWACYVESNSNTWKFLHDLHDANPGMCSIQIQGTVRRDIDVRHRHCMIVQYAQLHR